MAAFSSAWSYMRLPALASTVSQYLGKHTIQIIAN